MRILNLFAGAGGNRAMWGEQHEIVAVEHDSDIAAAYAWLWPNDEVIVTDAHAFLLEHFREFDFIWTSPPCPTHSRYQLLQVGAGRNEVRFPDGMLFEELAFLTYWCQVPWVVENVIPYYGAVLAGGTKIHRHMYWSNFELPDLPDKPAENIRSIQIGELQQLHGINLDGIRLKDKRQVLRNMVDPIVGLAILDSARLSRASIHSVPTKEETMIAFDRLQSKIAALSLWIDQSYIDDRESGVIPGDETHVRRRVDKLMEEVGEVGQAVGGWFAENPRKGRTHTRTDVLKELLDVMVTAAGAYESLTGNSGIVIDALDEHMDFLLERVGIGAPSDGGAS